MKKATFLVIVCFSIGGFSQKPEDLVRWLKTYHMDSPVEFDTAGFYLLPPEVNVCEQGEEKDWSNYHVADVNSDGLNDLIFSGLCMPYHQTIIYANTAEDRLLSYDFPGKVVGLEKSAAGIRIFIYSEACCCNYYNELSCISLNKEYEVENTSIIWHRDVVLEIGKPKKAVKAGVLRTAPKIDDHEYIDECLGIPVAGNQMLLLDKSTEVYVLSVKENWSLVLWEQERGLFWIGWIK